MKHFYEVRKYFVESPGRNKNRRISGTESIRVRSDGTNDGLTLIQVGESS
jgi:hypothetical protein